ncbi:MAG: hypothetical protein GWP14_01730 [Actinobacteria bacterium]|nr:hypothetical protein [Actinomycetota bacterium]
MIAALAEKPDWLRSLGAIVVAGLAGFLVHYLLFAIFKRVAARTASG